MKRYFLILFLFNITFTCFSQEQNNKIGSSILNKVKSNSKDGNLSDMMIDLKDGFLEDKIDELLKDIEGLNKDFESSFSNYVDKLLKENRNYLDQLENEYRTKLRDENEKITELKKM